MVLRRRQFRHSQKGISSFFHTPKFLPKITFLTFKYIALRYQLIPYVKTLFQMLHTSGKVILRPLYFDFSTSDEFVRKGTKTNDPVVVHQFMFGSFSSLGVLLKNTIHVRFFFFFFQDLGFLLRLQANSVSRHGMSIYPNQILKHGNIGKLQVYTLPF